MALRAMTDTPWRHISAPPLTALTLAFAARLLGGCNLGYEGLADIVNTGNTSGTCTTPVTPAARRIEASIADDGRFTDGGVPFRDLQDRDVLPIVVGSQGADMAVLKIRVTGVRAEACVAQRTTLTNAAGERVALLARPVLLRPVAPDVAESGELFLPGVFTNAPITLTVSLGGMTYTRTLRLRADAP